MANPDAGRARKFDFGKPRLDLNPPEVETAIAHVLTFGAYKYGDRNWELGMEWSRPYAALKRHLNAWWSGEDIDTETGMSHLWHAACNIAFWLHMKRAPTGQTIALVAQESSKSCW